MNLLQSLWNGGVVVFWGGEGMRSGKSEKAKV